MGIAVSSELTLSTQTNRMLALKVLAKLMAYSNACMEQREKSMATIICFMILLVFNTFAKL
jgi:hypothetical protein